MQAFYAITFACPQTRNMENFLCLDYEMELYKHSRSSNSICSSANCEANVTMTLQHGPHCLPDTSVTLLQRSAQPYVVSHNSLTHNYILYLLSSLFYSLFLTLLRKQQVAGSVGEKRQRNRNIFIFLF